MGYDSCTSLAAPRVGGGLAFSWKECHTREVQICALNSLTQTSSEHGANGSVLAGFRGTLSWLALSSTVIRYLQLGLGTAVADEWRISRENESEGSWEPRARGLGREPR